MMHHTVSLPVTSVIMYVNKVKTYSQKITNIYKSFNSLYTYTLQMTLTPTSFIYVFYTWGKGKKETKNNYQ